MKIKLSNDCITSVQAYEDGMIGCSDIGCITLDIKCNECNISKKGYDGVRIELEDIEDLLIFDNDVEETK